MRDELLAVADRCKSILLVGTQTVCCSRDALRMGQAQHVVEDWAGSINDAMAVFQGLQVVTMTVMPLMTAQRSHFWLWMLPWLVSLAVSILMFGFFLALRAIAQPNLIGTVLQRDAHECAAEPPSTFVSETTPTHSSGSRYDLSAARVGCRSRQSG